MSSTLSALKVRPERVALYKRHHQAVWPEVEKGLAAAGVETISIWSDPTDECSLYMRRASNFFFLFLS